MGEPPPSRTRRMLLVCAVWAASVWRGAAAMSDFSQMEERSMMFDMMAESANFGANIGACSSQKRVQWGLQPRQRVASETYDSCRGCSVLLRLRPPPAEAKRKLPQKPWVLRLPHCAPRRDRRAVLHRNTARRDRKPTPPVTPPCRASSARRAQREDPLRAFKTHPSLRHGSHGGHGGNPPKPSYANSASRRCLPLPPPLMEHPHHDSQRRPQHSQQPAHSPSEGHVATCRRRTACGANARTARVRFRPTHRQQADTSAHRTATTTSVSARCLEPV